MRKQVCCETPNRRARIAWLSFQPDGAISFGLNDRTYISPHFQAPAMIWNAYNRVGIQYLVSSSPDALQPVQNAQLPIGGLRQDGIAVDEIAVGAPDETQSVRMALDFIRPEDVLANPPDGEWHIPWHAVAIRLKLDLCPGQTATMSWFYFH